MPHFRKFHSIAALCGDGLRPELQALFERLAVSVHSLPIPNARVVHSVLHRNIPGHTRVFHRPVR